jgi:hypothetical protein
MKLFFAVLSAGRRILSELMVTYGGLRQEEKTP